MNITILQIGKANKPPLTGILNKRIAKLLGYKYNYIEMEPLHYAEIHYKTARMFALYNYMVTVNTDALIFLSEESFIDDPLNLLEIMGLFLASSKYGLYYRSTSTYISTDFFIVKNNEATKRLYKTIALSTKENREYATNPPYDNYYVSNHIKIHRDLFYTLTTKSPINTDEAKLEELLKKQTQPLLLESEPDFHVHATIPKVFFQTAKEPPQKYMRTMIDRYLSSDWNYLFFKDDDILDYFTKNPIEEFPSIVEKFHSFKKGAHRADLFRYYYLYKNGGVFMDSDAMIYEYIDKIVDDRGFFSVNSSCHPGSIFQGIIGSAPNNPIIYTALKHMYTIETSSLDLDYHKLVRALFNIVTLSTTGYNFKFYRELRDDNYGDKILDDNDKIIFMHYWQRKTIPKDISVVPKQFIQTSRDPLPAYVKKMCQSKLGPGWSYTHFLDEDIIEFFKANPHKDFPAIKERFYQIRHGAHRADLFRYYYLYLKGGVFLDSDAMIYMPIETILKDYSFIAVSSYHPETIFQGFLCTTANNPIIREALTHIYTVESSELDVDYFLVVKELYQIVSRQDKPPFKYKLLKELTDSYQNKEDKRSTHALILDDTDTVVAKHYWKSKAVPLVDNQ